MIGDQSNLLYDFNKADRSIPLKPDLKDSKGDSHTLTDSQVSFPNPLKKRKHPKNSHSKHLQKQLSDYERMISLLQEENSLLQAKLQGPVQLQDLRDELLHQAREEIEYLKSFRVESSDSNVRELLELKN